MKYTIRFLDYWHLSSGVSAGAMADSMVVKDSLELPYVPGKTIKGLAREALEAIDDIKPSVIDQIFGAEGSHMGKSYFSNATLDQATKDKLKNHQELIPQLYSKIASTMIDANGIAADNTLREIEVVIPLSLSGEIECDPQYQPYIQKALQSIKQMGLNRNRGLGRCQVEVTQ